MHHQEVGKSPGCPGSLGVKPVVAGNLNRFDRSNRRGKPGNVIGWRVVFRRAEAEIGTGGQSVGWQARTAALTGTRAAMVTAMGRSLRIRRSSSASIMRAPRQ
jgi:hypothetical protein